eukprot:CAMPEP_0194038026 /NCGR_PEP_ID=MMETSP0009_2-20130614/10296_1 /TAXON_ID=210454 /ORGANISM="Grammatophora oceanica, Strain CCMP 410" /LENGTH=620 /DNA_ID=CAMNT_0038680387 /DNA_START=43 /DNA_END=1902 /DNA_ORIENTATION=+
MRRWNNCRRLVVLVTVPVLLALAFVSPGANALVSLSSSSACTPTRTSRCVVLLHQKSSADDDDDRPKRRRKKKKSSSNNKYEIPMRIRKIVSSSSENNNNDNSTSTSNNNVIIKTMLESDLSWNNEQKKRRPHQRYNDIPSPQQVANQFREEMADHDLLTKEEEFELGREIQEATHLQESLGKKVEEKLYEIQEAQLQNQQMLLMSRRSNNNDEYYENEYFGEDPTMDDDDESMLLLSRAYPEYREEQDSMLFEEYMQEEEFRSMEKFQPSHIAGSHGFSILNQYDDASLSLDDLEPEDREPFQRHNFEQLSKPELDDSILSEAEIKAAFNGLGRNQLRSKILKGALAKERLIRCNLRLVMSIARNWARITAKGVRTDTFSQIEDGNMYRPSIDEAIHEGVLGLARAAEKYDPSRGLKFSTYAHYWITSRVRTCYQERRLGVNTAPRRYYLLKNKYQKFLRHCYNSGTEIPPTDEIAEILGVTEARLTKVLSMTRPVLSLNDPVSSSTENFDNDGSSGSPVELGDLLLSQEDPPHEYVDWCFLRQSLEDALATELTPTERDIIRLRLGLDDGKSRTAKEVAAFCGGAMTIHEVRRVERLAYSKLQSDQLMAFIDIEHIRW